MERPTTGSIHSLVWSTDGTQIAATCANGQILIAHIIERFSIVSSQNYIFFIII